MVLRFRDPRAPYGSDSVARFLGETNQCQCVRFGHREISSEDQLVAPGLHADSLHVGARRRARGAMRRTPVASSPLKNELPSPTDRSLGVHASTPSKEGNCAYSFGRHDCRDLVTGHEVGVGCRHPFVKPASKRDQDAAGR